MKKSIFLIVLSLLITACMSKEDIAQILIGTWEGSSDDGSTWCITYFDDEDKSLVLYLTRNANTDSALPSHLTGYWETARGMRFRQDVEHTHYGHGGIIPPEKRSGIFQQYFIQNVQGSRFTYTVENKKDNLFTNHKADNCDAHKDAFEKHIKTLQANKVE